VRRSYSGARSFRCCEKKSDRSSGVRLPVKGVLWRSRVAVSVVLVKNAAISSGVPSRMRSHSRWGAMGSGAWATFRRSAKAFGSSALPADYRTTVIAAGGGGSLSHPLSDVLSPVPDLEFDAEAPGLFLGAENPTAVKATGAEFSIDLAVIGRLSAAHDAEPLIPVAGSEAPVTYRTFYSYAVLGTYLLMYRLRDPRCGGTNIATDCFSAAYSVPVCSVDCFDYCTLP
jgi:hypothetical protein